MRPSIRRPAALAAAVAAACSVMTATACRDSRDAARDAARDSGAVASSVGRAASDAPSQSARRIAPPLDHPRWTRGGSERDTIFSYPRSLAVDDRHVYVLDADTHQLSALRRTDGSLAWQAGGRRDSSVTPVAIATAAGGSGVTLADAAHGRLLTLDDDGRPTASVPFAAAADARSLCAVGDTTFLVAGADPSGALLRVVPGEPTPTRVPFPWPDLATRSRLVVQTTLASAPGARGCVVALALGRGFAIYDGAAYVVRTRYVEPFDLPGVVTTVRGDSAAYTRTERLDDSRLAARDVALSGNRVAVAFDGGSPLRARVVDFYDRRTGAYAGSAPFMTRIAALADDGHDLYLAFVQHGRAAVAAFPYPTLDGRDTTTGRAH